MDTDGDDDTDISTVESANTIMSCDSILLNDENKSADNKIVMRITCAEQNKTDNTPILITLETTVFMNERKRLLQCNI